VSQDERRPVVEALRRAQEAAFGPGEYVEQESFVRASEILALARQAAVDSGVSVLDLCCGVAGPGRFDTRELGCVYLGVDSSESAVAILLTLLHLGIKDIRLGPTLPAFVTPNVLQVLVDNFDIKPIGESAEADLAVILGETA
jgi:hypothetical protein